MNNKPVPPTPPMNGTRIIRVLIVDDSPIISGILTAMLEDLPDIQVVGQAVNGLEAIRLAVRLQPDVITMDIRMPQMDGLEAIRRIMSIRPTPIIVVSSSVYASDYNVAFAGIEAGALTIIEKPKGLGFQDYEAVRSQLITNVRTMSGVTVVARHQGLHKPDSVGIRTGMLNEYFLRPIQIVAIASSTGGPPVLMQIFKNLPKDFSIPIVVVQHILPQFNQGLIEWLNGQSALPASLAKEGDRLLPGKIIVAPGDKHLLVGPGSLINLDDSEPVKGQKPSANRMFESVARHIRSNGVGIILSGMGDDGVDGLELLSKAGAHIIAQDEASSVIFGMPKAAIQRGIVDEILSPDRIIQRLTKLHRHMQSLAASNRNSNMIY